MSVQINPRRSTDRGHADHDWLKTFHTFSFASYHDSKHQSFGALRVLNEDRVAPGTGFGTHQHQQYEIFSYVVSGALEHKDSMNNVEVLPRGALQSTSAGTGIAHSEHAHGSAQVHFLQIWASPYPGLGSGTPAYFTRMFPDEAKHNRLALLVAPSAAVVPDTAAGTTLDREGTGPVPVRALLWMHAGLLDPGVALAHTLAGPAQMWDQTGKRKGYVHVVQQSGYNPGGAAGAAVRISPEAEGGKGVELREGDGAYLVYEKGAALELVNVGDGVAEVLVFDLE